MVPARPRRRYAPRTPTQVVHNFSRTRAEARVVYRDAGEGSEEIAIPTQMFSLFDITSGLLDDSGEAERTLCDFRGGEGDENRNREHAGVARAPREEL